MSEQLTLDEVSKGLGTTLPAPGLVAAKAPSPSAFLKTHAIAIALAVGCLALAAWGFTTSQNLDRTQIELSSLQGELADAQRQAASLSAQLTALNATVASQSACISGLGTAKGSLDAIRMKQVDVVNLTATGSVWHEATLARNVALSAAIDDYYNGFSEAWDSHYATANSWIDKGNEQIRIAGAKLTVMNAEIDKANVLLNEINGMLAAAGQVDLSRCGTGGGASSG